MAKQARSSGLDGVVVIDKPPGMTSHDVVGRVRHVLHQRRAGHGGTLDPDASGVLVVGLGRATRLLRFATSLSKSYQGEVVLGSSTTSLDASGEVTGTYEMGAVDLEQARVAARTLVGQLQQVPPMVSALRVGGRRLHELARAGIEVDRAPRPVTVTRFAVNALHDGVLSVEVDCSAGTYVRSLADDLGRALGGGAHLRHLRRTAVGPFSASEARRLEELGLADVAPPEQLVADLASCHVTGEQIGFVGHGRVLSRDELGAKGDGPWTVFGDDGELLAVYEARGDRDVKPMLVLVEASHEPVPPIDG